MESSHPPLVRTRLSIMMFFEFFIWGGWGFALSAYAKNTLGFEGSQVGWLVAIPALGAIISPLFMGLIADRYFPTEKMLCVVHVLSGACLIMAARQVSFPLLMTFMMLHGLLFMPTIALANSVAFRHIPDASKFPRIAMFGTIGWIVAVLIASVFLGGTGTSGFLYLSGVGSIILGVYALSLPHTPPKGAEAGGDVFGFKALKLLREPSFLIFIVCVFLVSIPACGYFFLLTTPMLEQRGYPAALALTTLCQFAEIIFMFTMPWFVMKLGLKRVLMIGMLAWGVRYLIFIPPNFGLAIIGLLLHGFCYSFVYVAAYMYVDKRAPAELKASAQSLLTFLLIGLGWFFGAKMGGYMLDRYPPQIDTMPPVATLDITDHGDATEEGAGMVIVKLAKGKEPAKVLVSIANGVAEFDNAPKALPAWNDPTAKTSIWRFTDLSGTLKELMGKAEPAKPDLAEQLDADKDGKITLAEIEKAKGDEVTVNGVAYNKDNLIKVFKQIASSAKEADDQKPDDSLTRDQWLKAQSANWLWIWLYPAIVVLVILAFFAAAFRDKPEDEEEPAADAKPEETAGDDA